MTPGYDKEKQILVLAHIMRDPQLMNMAIHLKVRPDDFDLPACSFLWEVARNYYQRHRALLDANVVASEIEFGLSNYYGNMTVSLMDSEKESLYHVLTGVYTCVLNSDYYRHQIAIFLQGVRMQKLSLRMSDTTLTQPERKMLCDEAARLADIGTGPVEMLSFFADDPSLLTSLDNEERIPTGLRFLDSRIDGGLGRGELAQITACPSVGKTTSLINFGLGALDAGFYPLFITLEQPKRQINRRFAAMRAGIPAMWVKKPLNMWPPEMLQRYNLAAQDTERLMFAVSDLSAGTDKTVDMIERSINEWQEEMSKRGFSRGAWLVLVDYLDEIIPPRDQRLGKNARTDEFMTSTAKELGRMAIRLNIGMWTCTQGTRDADGRSILGQRHTSGAFHKNDPLTIGIGVGPKEADLAKNAALPGEYEEYTDAHASEGEELKFTINKNRNSVKGSFCIYRGPTLKFWDRREDAEQEQYILGKAPSHCIGEFHALLARTPNNDKDAVIESYKRHYSL